MNLSVLAVGQSARVREVTGEDGGAQRLRDLGFLAGAEVRCLFSHPMGDPRAYLVGGGVIALDRSAAARVLLENGGVGTGGRMSQGATAAV